MHKWSIRISLIVVALATALAGADQARAAGAVPISACQTLSTANTTYELTTDLTSCGSCLIVAANRITIDLQGHSITNTGCLGSNAAITDQLVPFDVITVKNGTVSNWFAGVYLFASTRVSVLGVTAHDNANFGIVTGAQGLVKASTTYNNGAMGIWVVGDRGQVQQCNSHDNGVWGIFGQGANCLITMNTANSNHNTGIETGGGNKCTVSLNTTSNNAFYGIVAGTSNGGSGHLVTQNVALGNGSLDYLINCPSTVTYNDSTNGFPASYGFSGAGCHTVNNN